MKASVTLEGLDRALKAELERVDRIESQEIAEGAKGLKDELRQATAPVLGRRVAFAWQSRFYADDKAGFVYTRTPEIIDFNMRAPLVTPIRGRRYLAIATKNVPRGGRGGRPMTPEQVEQSFNQDLILQRGKQGRILGFVEMVRAFSRRRPGLRAATKTRLEGRKGLRARQLERIHMFTFVPAVRGRAVIDPDAIFQRWADLTARAIEAKINVQAS